MQYKQRIKILSLLVSVCLMIGMLPMTVAAKDETLVQSYSSGEATTTPSVLTLSATQAVSGKLLLTDSDSDAHNLSQDHSGLGWTWVTTSSTLTIDSNFAGTRIYIECEKTDIINFHYKGNVEMSSKSRSNIFCGGVLNVDGSEGTLTLESSMPAITSNYGLTISSGTIVAKRTGIGWAVINSSYGSITIKGDANVTAESTGTSGANYAIYMQDDFNVTDNAQVTATIQGAGIAISSGRDIIIKGSANVIAKSNATSNDMNCSGISAGNSRNIVISTTGAVTAKGTGKNSYGLRAGNKIEISSGTVNVEAGGENGGVTRGGLYIEGNAQVTVAATEANSNVINSGYYDINIAGGSLKATAKGNGFALESKAKVLMSAGTVKLYNSDSDNFILSEVQYTGGILSVNDKNINAFINIAEKLQDMQLAEGNISDSLTVLAVATNSETLSYLWQFDDSGKGVYIDIPSATSATFPIPINLGQGVYSYRCKISSENTLPVYSEAEVLIEKPRTIIVNNGTGGGKYVPGTEINITANTAPQGQCFEKWEISPSNHFLMNRSSITDATVKFEVHVTGTGTTFTALYQPLGASHHAITVQNDGNGIANADVNSATQGTQITLTPVPNSDYQFKEWQVDHPAELAINGNTFIMPAQNVQVKAIFESTRSYGVVLNANGGSVSPLIMHTEAGGKLVGLPTPTRSGDYSFEGWYTQQSGGTAVTQDTIFTTSTTLYAHWKAAQGGGSSDGGGSSGGSGSSGGGGSNSTVEKTTKKVVEEVVKDLSTSQKEALVTAFTEELPYTMLNENLALQKLNELTNNKFTTQQLKEIMASPALLENLGLKEKISINKVTLKPISEASFTDVEPTHWANNAIKEAAALGLVAGMPDGSFAPSASLQVADTFAFLDRVLLLNDVTAMKLPRSTVEKYITNKDHWAFTAMASIASKLSEPTLKTISQLGDESLSRELLAQVIYEVTNGKLKPIREAIAFEDTTDSPYKEAIDYCTRAGILNGVDATHMLHHKALTRAELMTILINLNKNLKK